jgi:geranylgeranyl pyrophosphate synthase
LVDFSNDVGLIFQLVDDLLDGISSFEKMGKKVQKDQINKKNTGFTILGVEGLKKEISLISDKIDNYIKENNLTGTYLDYIVKFVYQRSY